MRDNTALDSAFMRAKFVFCGLKGLYFALVESFFSDYGLWDLFREANFLVYLNMQHAVPYSIEVVGTRGLCSGSYGNKKSLLLCFRTNAAVFAEWLGAFLIYFQPSKGSLCIMLKIY